MSRTMFRFFTITDYELEEQWIHEMFLKGWKHFYRLYRYTITGIVRMQKIVVRALMAPA